MPILTPCADTDPANKTPHAATATDHNPDFIFVSLKFLFSRFREPKFAARGFDSKIRLQKRAAE
jgi:hypothetical protein